jgi:hypothetical protein
VIAVPVEMTTPITCTAVLLPVNITLESSWMCNYVNYHITMLILFGSVSLTFSLITLLLWLCNSTHAEATSTRYCATWALTTAILSTGFEGPIIMFYLCVLLIIVHMMIERCIFERHVHPQDEMGEAAEGRRELGEDNGEEEGTSDEVSKICSICLGTVTGPWLKTRCNHTFHRECLQKWQRNTCPLCRQEVVVVLVQ